MKDEEIEVLFEDEEDIELNKKRKDEENKNDDVEEDFVKDPSLDDVFPDKDDVNINRLLEKFEESSDSEDVVSETFEEEVEKKDKKKSKNNKKNEIMANNFGYFDLFIYCSSSRSGVFIIWSLSKF